MFHDTAAVDVHHVKGEDLVAWRAALVHETRCFADKEHLEDKKITIDRWASGRRKKRSPDLLSTTVGDFVLFLP